MRHSWLISKKTTLKEVIMNSKLIMILTFLCTCCSLVSQEDLRIQKHRNMVEACENKKEGSQCSYYCPVCRATAQGTCQSGRCTI
jgi:hypothetical protein